jgi:uncharacterized membrane protein
MDFPNVDRRRALSGALGAVLVFGVLGLAGFAVAPVPATSGDTAFYVVNESGSAAGYPTQPTVGESVSVVVGIENDEHRRMSYELVVRTVPREFETRTMTVDDGDRWERSISLSFERAGEKRVRLYLYRDGETDGPPYRELHLNFDVRRA